MKFYDRTNPKKVKLTEHENPSNQKIYVLENVDDPLEEIGNGTPLNAENLNKGNWRDDTSLSFKKSNENDPPTAKSEETQIVTTLDGDTWVIPPAGGQNAFKLGSQLKIGKVTTLSADSNATVTMSDGQEGVQLNFGLPRGEKGERGEPGIDGKDFRIVGTVNSVAELNVLTGVQAGDAYFVGSETPRQVYVYDKLTNSFQNQGYLQGEKGESGEAGRRGSQIFYGTEISAVNLVLRKNSLNDQQVMDYYYNTSTSDFLQLSKIEYEAATGEYVYLFTLISNLKGKKGQGFVLKGVWASGTQYTDTDEISVVYYNGNSYACKLTHTATQTNRPGSTQGESFWTLMTQCVGIPVIETDLTLDKVPYDLTAWYHFSQLQGVMINQSIYHISLLYCEKVKNVPGDTYFQRAYATVANGGGEIQRQKFVGPGMSFGTTDWSDWRIKDGYAGETSDGIMKAEDYNKLNTPSINVKNYQLNGSSYVIGGQGAVSHSSGKYNYIGRYISGGTVTGSAEVCFTNCAGTITVNGNSCKIYVVNSPNLTVNGITASNWRNIYRDGKARWVLINSSFYLDRNLSALTILKSGLILPQPKETVSVQGYLSFYDWGGSLFNECMVCDNESGFTPITIFRSLSTNGVQKYITAILQLTEGCLKLREKVEFFNSSNAEDNIRIDRIVYENFI